MDKYDVGIIGAGIAGSCLAILLAQQGKKVVIFEKELYPKHKVCGEFISLESYDFFKQIGLSLDDWNLPIIKELELTSQKGASFKRSLKIGGFGLSRAKLDFELTQLFNKYNITFYPNTKVDSVDGQSIYYNKEEVVADFIVGAHGKYSASYTHQKRKLQKKNYVGVKYHIKGDFDPGLISLHSFEGGYCGMSKIEDNQYCLCYLCESSQLKASNNNVQKLEENVLMKNLKLKSILESAEFLWDKPLIISNIRFDKELLFDNTMLFAGDAAGSISPLSGNGMSIAAKTALMLSEICRTQDDFSIICKEYDKAWNQLFGSKVERAKTLNRIMLNPTTHHWVIRLFKLLPPIGSIVINSMQGKPFYVRK
ncbi:MAG: NAD(P)/FAD-dependent oxidoreductase [Bacteroidia bacterium]|nr:NAD(P)/FAD-dependent oxidoreductase [Bacteroidia bacterium]NNJ55483.1 NAD(P)/FAD-dependent oxidoreductase [Bacteroidia bacterium]